VALTKPRTEDDRAQLLEIGRYLTHINTLASGSVVVIATFADKFRGDGPGWLLVASLVFFALTLFAGLFAMLINIGIMGTARESDTRLNLFAWFTIFALLAFTVALVCLSVYAAIAVT